jgi:hypothetical protein
LSLQKRQPTPPCFTDRHRIPALKERTDELPFILDCLLHPDSINSAGAVKENGQRAFDLVKSHGFEEGNFRQFEDPFCAACQCDGRDYSAKSNFDTRQPAPKRPT